MKVTLLQALGFKFKVTLWFKNNPTPFVMYVIKFSYSKKGVNFTEMEWEARRENYQFNIDEVIALKYKIVWRP